MYGIKKPNPSRLWYVGHFFFGITVPICWFVWKDKNREMAKRHLIVGGVLAVIGYIAGFLAF